MRTVQTYDLAASNSKTKELLEVAEEIRTLTQRLDELKRELGIQDLEVDSTSYWITYKNRNSTQVKKNA